jgi:hypothetical protein
MPTQKLVPDDEGQPRHNRKHHWAAHDLTAHATALAPILDPRLKDARPEIRVRLSPAPPTHILPLLQTTMPQYIQAGPARSVRIDGRPALAAP